MSYDEELNRILNDTKRFLKQQEELYGDTLFIYRSEDPTMMKSPEPAKKTEIKTREVDLFGNVSIPTETNQIKGSVPLHDYPKAPWINAKNLVGLDATS